MMSSLSISGRMDTSHTQPNGQQAVASTSSGTSTQQSNYASKPYVVPDSLDLDELDGLENMFTLRSAVFDTVSYEDMPSTWFTSSSQPGVREDHVLLSNDASASSFTPTPPTTVCNNSPVVTAGTTPSHESVQASPRHHRDRLKGTTPSASPRSNLSASTSSPEGEESSVPSTEEARILQRRARNRVAAHKSRQRRRDYVEGLQQQITSLSTEVTKWKAYVDLMEGVMERNGIESPPGYEM
ncbi:hypothetical protein CYLTODRAFT_420311 [Cylindrobasidium torrendii FP15055 ss-10]|uniref:BZIP domain-containing protein n=1 Tax=Cylindrobasidium torrendii FP15055 ss-10 TaxID=1314674 RepID=A0A0D7BH16_9AGAR|nr:hypothetical protein CYLTODRAFT_420311 [Cylindrobasidium torrendii FP15055 ss-10]